MLDPSQSYRVQGLLEMVGRSVLEETFSSSTMTPYRNVKQWQNEVKAVTKTDIDTTVIMAGDINKFP